MSNRSDRPEVFTYKDKRGVSWDAFLLFDQYFAKSARGEQCQAGDADAARAEIERIVTPPKR